MGAYAVARLHLHLGDDPEDCSGQFYIRQRQRRGTDNSWDGAGPAESAQ